MQLIPVGICTFYVGYVAVDRFADDEAKRAEKVVSTNLQALGPPHAYNRWIDNPKSLALTLVRLHNAYLHALFPTEEEERADGNCR